MTKSLTAIFLLALASPVFAQSPGAPQNLTAGVNGSTVTLNWAPPNSGGAPTSYVVEAAVTPGGPLVASLPVAGTSLTVPNVPTGTYFVHIRAANGSGQSGPSNEVTVSVAGSGCPGPPVPPQFTVRATGLTVTLNWASAGGCAPDSFVLQAGSAPGLSDVAQVNMGGQLGLVTPAPAGVYHIRVIGTNAFGSAVSEELTARVDVNAFTDTVPPLGALSFDTTFTATGTFVGTLIWNDPAIDLDFYLTSAGCPYPPTNCALAISDGTGVNSEQVTFPVTAGQSYRFWVDNFTNRTTSFTVVSTVTAGGAVTTPQADTDESATAPRAPKIKQ